MLADLAKKKLNAKNLFIQVLLLFTGKKKYISEKSDIRPDSIYGVSKYAGELFLRQLLGNTKVKTYIFRVFNTYGPGENLNNLKKGMVSIFCSYVWQKKPIIVKGSLNRFRNFTYIDDCVEILAKSIYNSKLKNFEIFNLTSEKKITVKELIKKILKIKNLKKYKIKVIKGTPGDSFGFDSKNSYLKNKFTKIKFIDIESGLKKYFKWIDRVPKNKSSQTSSFFKKSINYLFFSFKILSTISIINSLALPFTQILSFIISHFLFLTSVILVSKSS